MGLEGIQGVRQRRQCEAHGHSRYFHSRRTRWRLVADYVCPQAIKSRASHRHWRWILNHYMPGMSRISLATRGLLILAPPMGKAKIIRLSNVATSSSVPLNVPHNVDVSGGTM